MFAANSLLWFRSVSICFIDVTAAKPTAITSNIHITHQLLKRTLRGCCAMNYYISPKIYLFRKVRPSWKAKETIQ